MSFLRLIFYSAMVGGWAALAGWFLGEAALMQRSAAPKWWMGVVTAALCGSLIGGGLNFLAGLVSGSLVRALPRLGLGLGAGFVSGALGGLLGSGLYALIEAIAPTVAVIRLFGLMIGWTVMGGCIGVVEGLYDLNFRKIRNGVIGGAVGGLTGGFLFGVFTLILRSPMSSRAVAFVILGMCIGLAIGLAQVVLRDAWLTVEEGFRPGRQLLLSRLETFLGTSEKAQLIFIAVGAKGVEPLHVCVARLPDGTYEVRDNGSRTGTFVNEQRIEGSAPLRNQDVIRLGINKVRFNERFRAAGARQPPPPLPTVRQPSGPPPMPVANAIRAALAPAPVETAVQVQAVRVASPLHAAPAPIPLASPTTPTALPTTTPLPGAVPPAAAPATPAPSAQTPSPMQRPGSGRADCPICGTPANGPAGKRRCENCGSVF
jgi:hypothetical protein